MLLFGGGSDKTVRVWDAQTLQCLEAIRGSSDVAAIAARTSSGLPWRAIARGQETVIEPVVGDGESVAQFPIALSNITKHPNGRIWAGSAANRLYIITLEGEPKPAQQNDGNEGQPN